MIKGIDNILFTLQTSVKIEETEIKRLLRLLKHGRRKKKLLRYIRKIENEDVHKELFNDFIEECKINKEIDENQLNNFKFIDDNEYLRLFFAVYPNEKKWQTIQDRTKNIASYLEEIAYCLEEKKWKIKKERFEMFCDFITIIRHTSYRKTYVNSIYKILELMKEWGVILDNYVKHFDAIINENDLFDKLYAEEEYYLIIEYLLLFNVKKDKEKRMKIEEIIEKIKKGDEYIIRFDTIKLLNNMWIYFIPNN